MIDERAQRSALVELINHTPFSPMLRMAALAMVNMATSDQILFTAGIIEKIKPAFESGDTEAARQILTDAKIPGEGVSAIMQMLANASSHDQSQ